GCAKTKFPRIFREYNREYKLDIVNLLETRVSGGKADKIIASLGFQCSHRVEATGFFGGGTLWVAIGYFNALLTSSDKKKEVVRLVKVVILLEIFLKEPTYMIWDLGALPSLGSEVQRLRDLIGLLGMMHGLEPSLVARLVAEWVEHPNFSEFVNDKWSYKGNMVDTLHQFTSDVRVWNKNIYRHIVTRKRALLQELS
ncbi:hypothetical protein Gorai_016746, partial [Gossypium raimondii]|nr:hypothetical protein [Gossypium raimondii]